MITSLAIRLLKEAGYDVEFAYGIVYVRADPTSIPDRLYERKGKVSDQKVKTLLKRKNPSVALQRIIDEVKAPKDLGPWGGYNRTYHRHNR
jgi:hypothetical protein